jgi:hypothetical protein
VIFASARGSVDRDALEVFRAIAAAPAPARSRTKMPRAM